LKKIILFIESELSLLYLQINTPQQTKPPIKIISGCDWKITENDLIELARALYVAKIAFRKGKRMKFIDVERKLEEFFEMKIKRPHNKVSRISERVNVSPFLDYLKECYIEDLESRL
jgi:hypothetical protein